jgi:hypothetical protein
MSDSNSKVSIEKLRIARKKATEAIEIASQLEASLEGSGIHQGQALDALDRLYGVLDSIETKIREQGGK